MKSTKKQIRRLFRESCLKRDKYSCVKCEIKQSQQIHLEVHHISDRTTIPGGGYVLENGISLCEECHLKAEMFHATGTSFPGYSPEDLYQAIASSKELAVSKSHEFLQIDGNR